MVKNGKHTYLGIDYDTIFPSKYNYGGILGSFFFKGMKAISMSCTKGSQTLLKGSTPFKRGLAIWLPGCEQQR